LEGAALLWLFHRVPHPGLRLTGFGLLVAAFVRLALNQEVLRYHERSAVPIFNWYLYTFGLADFVNRRLYDDETGLKGPIQAAIDRAGVNAAFETRYPLDNRNSLPDVSFDNMRDTTRLEQKHKPQSVAWGLPGFLTQGDVLQAVGSTLRARSDTFMIRAYGESVSTQADGTKVVQARAWCEAVVQRTPEPIVADAVGLNPVIVNESRGEVDFGRRFRVISFRWMTPDEI
jgi:hypothetical protein